jgi:hypothetical protein
MQNCESGIVRYEQFGRLTTRPEEDLMIGIAALDHPADYFTWGIWSISAPNLILFAILVLLFVGALLLPFPKGGE